MRLKALLNHLKDDTWDINADMYDVFNDLLTRENWELIAAYELYLVTEDKEEFVDTLFVIYKIHSGSTQINDEEELRQEQYELKRSMETILFQYKSKIDSKIYEKLIDLVKCNDTKTKELYDVYRKDKEEKKFLQDLSQYALEKIKRSEQIMQKAAGNTKKANKTDWREELSNLTERFSSKLKLPDFMLHKDLIEYDIKLSESIALVGVMRNDYGDAIETLNLLKNKYILGNRF